MGALPVLYAGATPATGEGRVATAGARIRPASQAQRHGIGTTKRHGPGKTNQGG